MSAASRLLLTVYPYNANKTSEDEGQPFPEAIHVSVAALNMLSQRARNADLKKSASFGNFSTGIDGLPLDARVNFKTVPSLGVTYSREGKVFVAYYPNGMEKPVDILEFSPQESSDWRPESVFCKAISPEIAEALAKMVSVAARELGSGEVDDSWRRGAGAPSISRPYIPGNPGEEEVFPS